LTPPLGYRYAATYAGIRKTKKDDVALIVSETPAAAAAVFTQNRVQAAPVHLARKHLRVSGGKVRAILVNAGNANCATRTGDRVALDTSRAAAKQLGCRTELILPASTGVIGVELDSRLILKSLPALAKRLSSDGFKEVAHAIMTTDTVPKIASREISIRNRAVRIAGMTKGSGMIMPNMATTLGFIMTDAEIPPAQLRGVLNTAVERSYNRISVDGDTSTNDTVALLANGASGVRPKSEEREQFQQALNEVLEDLARQIARDGEGARKLITIDVTGAADDTAAATIARAIANSPLVKTAIAGSDPNWGRIISAAGNAGIEFDPSRVDIWLQDVQVCEAGLAADFPESELKKLLDQRECSIRFALRGRGHGESRFWTCDFTEDYIKINASYRT
jgi:glutamate N-acetyltransferase / amino-acid N-acetyltransferase